jgi:DnaJ-class molecular chaperone
MPIKSSAGRGRLIIKFHIDFPKYLQNEAKEALVELLS